MSDRFTKYGIIESPNSLVTTLLTGALNAWSYDYKNPLNQLRDRSIQLRNLGDEALAKFTDQLKSEISSLRKKLPQPTRENPYPPMDGLEAVKELEAYMREVESIRIQLRSASVPPQECVQHNVFDNQSVLMELHSIDEEILSVLGKLTRESVETVKTLLSRRSEIASELSI